MRTRSFPASLLVALALGAGASAQVTLRVSVDSAGNPGDSWSGGFVQGRSLSISPDGRFVAFESLCTNLAPGDSNLWRDVFVHDRWSGATERVSVATGGADGNGPSQLPAISADGRFVVFASGATNFFAGDSNGVSDVFLRDRQLGTTERLGTGGSWAAISPDARFVAFASPDALVPGDANGLEDVFVLDRQLGTTDRVSVSTAGVAGNQSSSFPAMSPDGRYVAFQSSASSLVAGDTNGRADVFVRDRLLGTTERVSVGPGGAQAADASFSPS
ncbi:MAG TPA: hypothetical protein VGR00_07385, partial [Thermoanaerobaculia bacterium]|nr:hypothetical protein [Thermoanaerobaculia bacterium]